MCLSRFPARQIAVYGIFRDITARKEAEEELQRSFRQLRELTARLQRVREEERAKVAREIHDELGQALTAIKIDLIRAGEGARRRTRRAADSRTRQRRAQQRTTNSACARADAGAGQRAFARIGTTTRYAEQGDQPDDFDGCTHDILLFDDD